MGITTPQLNFQDKLKRSFKFACSHSKLRPNVRFTNLGDGTFGNKTEDY